MRVLLVQTLANFALFLAGDRLNQQTKAELPALVKRAANKRVPNEAGEGRVLLAVVHPCEQVVRQSPPVALANVEINLRLAAIMVKQRALADVRFFRDFGKGNVVPLLKQRNRRVEDLLFHIFMFWCSHLRSSLLYAFFCTKYRANSRAPVCAFLV
ncbi:hypothetical protein SDC9_168748 [bioreactor metagenome]|uniref:Uncharacterized protein n=1 Tax=bioreactor metagenome TaxID=1076179 RepID=A0A645G6D8_9ZZZZ